MISVATDCNSVLLILREWLRVLTVRCHRIKQDLTIGLRDAKTEHRRLLRIHTTDTSGKVVARSKRDRWTIRARPVHRVLSKKVRVFDKLSDCKRPARPRISGCRRLWSCARIGRQGEAARVDDQVLQRLLLGDALNVDLLNELASFVADVKIIGAGYDAVLLV